MKIIGFVTEYNPFHKGHKLHLERSKELSGAAYSVAVMSGSFVQRGEPALLDKWTRAKMAIDGGVDLVIELPVIYSVSTAELFALGGVKLLDSLNCIDYLGFGSEVGHIAPLSNIADVLVNESSDFKEILRANLKSGLSYANSRSIAVSSTLINDNYDYERIIDKSNNILGIEYIKALKNLKSSIEPITFKRIGSDYNDLSVDVKIASASAIRNLILNNGFNKSKNLLPQSSYETIMNFYDENRNFNNLNNYMDIISYILLKIDGESLLKYFDVENGLENRIKNINLSDYNVEDIITEITSKRIASSRVRRLLVHLLLDIKKDMIVKSKNHNLGYVRILGSNQRGFDIINKIKDSSTLEIINKFSEINKITNDLDKTILDKEILATNIYYYGLNKSLNSTNYDFIKSPYIKK